MHVNHRDEHQDVHDVMGVEEEIETAREVALRDSQGSDDPPSNGNDILQMVQQKIRIQLQNDFILMETYLEPDVRDGIRMPGCQAHSAQNHESKTEGHRQEEAEPTILLITDRG